MSLYPPDEDEFEEPLVNLTPLIDVVFVVLISFIIIAPMVSVDQVELASRGEESKTESPTATPLSITVKADNSVWYKGAPIGLRELTAKLKKERKEPVAQLIQDRRSSFGTYQEVKNALEAAGYERLDVVLK